MDSTRVLHSSQISPKNHNCKHEKLGANDGPNRPRRHPSNLSGLACFCTPKHFLSLLPTNVFHEWGILKQMHKEERGGVGRADTPYY